MIKSFQPTPGFILHYLRTDVYPPLYYLGLWGWGQIAGQTAISLRLFSWVAYIFGGALISLQAAGLEADQSELPVWQHFWRSVHHFRSASPSKGKVMPTSWC